LHSGQALLTVDHVSRLDLGRCGGPLLQRHGPHEVRAGAFLGQGVVALGQAQLVDVPLGGVALGSKRWPGGWGCAVSTGPLS